MDLFQNDLNKNGLYVRPVPEKVREVMIDEFEETSPAVAVGEDGNVDVSILPQNSVEVCSQFLF